MTYGNNTSYFKVAPPCHTIAYKNIDNSLKMVIYILICYIASKFVQEIFKISLYPRGF